VKSLEKANANAREDVFSGAKGIAFSPCDAVEIRAVKNRYGSCLVLPPTPSVEDGREADRQFLVGSKKERFVSVSYPPTCNRYRRVYRAYANETAARAAGVRRRRRSTKRRSSKRSADIDRRGAARRGAARRGAVRWGKARRDATRRDATRRSWRLARLGGTTESRRNLNVTKRDGEREEKSEPRKLGRAPSTLLSGIYSLSLSFASMCALLTSCLLGRWAYAMPSCKPYSCFCTVYHRAHENTRDSGKTCGSSTYK